MSHRHSHEHVPVHIWRWPVAIGIVSTIGLASALFSEGGFGDLLANVCLSIPVVVGGWFGWGRRQTRR